MIKVNVSGGSLDQKEIDAYIDHGKKKYPDKNIAQMDITVDGDYVDIKYTFGKAGGDVSGYSVKVIPNAIEGKDFDFTLDEQVYSYQAETDLTGGFDIEYGETSFTIKPKGSITDILRAVYPNNEIGDCSGKEYADMFTLVVTSYNGESSVLLHFVAVSTVTFIELDQEVIVF